MGPPIIMVKFQPVRRAASASMLSKYEGSILIALGYTKQISNNERVRNDKRLTLDIAQAWVLPAPGLRCRVQPPEFRYSPQRPCASAHPLARRDPLRPSG